MLIEIGEEVHKQNIYNENLMLDLLDSHLAQIAQLIYNAHYVSPLKYKDFLYLKHDFNEQTSLSKNALAIDAKIQYEASKLALNIKKKKIKEYISKTNKNG